MENGSRVLSSLHAWEGGRLTECGQTGDRVEGVPRASHY